jgi:DNA-binding transcriptional LysR family regulator
MDIRLLRYFQAVAEELSFSKAAQRLRIAQPALSRAVQELELELGEHLIDRNRRTVKLTAAGSVLLLEIGIILERLEDARRRVKRTAAGEEGELRLGYIGPPTRSFLGPLLKEYRQRHPGVTVILEERTPERVWEMVAKDKLNVGLTRPVLAHEALGLQTLLLRNERFCAAVPVDHEFADKASLSWKQLAGQPLILLARREGAGSHDAILAACQESKFTPKIVHTPSLIGTILQYVEAGAGIGIVPDSTLRGPGRLKHVPWKPAPVLPLVMVWGQEQTEPPAVAFRELVKRWLKEGKLEH